MEKFNDFVRKHKKNIFWWCFSISIASIVLLFIINPQFKVQLVTVFLLFHGLAAAGFYDFCQGKEPSYWKVPSPVTCYLLPYFVILVGLFFY